MGIRCNPFEIGPGTVPKNAPEQLIADAMANVMVHVNLVGHLVAGINQIHAVQITFCIRTIQIYVICVANIERCRI